MKLWAVLDSISQIAKYSALYRTFSKLSNCTNRVNILHYIVQCKFNNTDPSHTTGWIKHLLVRPKLTRAWEFFSFEVVGRKDYLLGPNERGPSKRRILFCM